MEKTQYNVLVILHPDLPDEGYADVLGLFKNQIIEHGGEIKSEQNWGKRRLAYPIRKKDEGIYVDMDFQGGNEVVAHLEEFVTTEERVMRFLCTVLPKAKFLEDERKIKAEARERVRKEAEVARKAEMDARRAAEAARQAALAEVQKEAKTAAAAEEIRESLAKSAPEIEAGPEIQPEDEAEVEVGLSPDSDEFEQEDDSLGEIPLDEADDLLEDEPTET
jgi:small subunit ribosomal protein S6